MALGSDLLCETYPAREPSRSSRNIKNNRSQNVNIVDLRVEKFFQVNDRMRLTAMLDFYNLFNSNPETNFTLRTGSSFRNIIAALDPRAMKIGVRFQF